jgi:hypothetical protein
MILFTRAAKAPDMVADSPLIIPYLIFFAASNQQKNSDKSTH